MGDTTAGDRAIIGRSLPRVLDWYAARRRRQIERACGDAAALQERALLDIVSAARDTEFGLVHGLSGVRSVAEYQERVPVRDYGYFRPLWDRVIGGDSDVAWPGRCRDWVATAATMGPAKLIPLTADSLRSHRRGGFDAVLLSVGRVGARGLAGGASLVLGGSPATRPLGGGCRLVDLSALAAQHLPAGLECLCAPAPDVAAIEDWDERLEAVAATAARHDLRLLWGMPAWLLQVFERVARHRQAIGRPIRDLGQCWPHLSVLVHGGMGFTPYAAVFDEWLGRRLERVEIYAAAEAFVALQTEAAGLTLMPDYGVFYEFVPVEDLGSERPRRHTVADAELHRPYAVAVTTAAGLWSYLLGDTVRFTAREPLRLAVTGRTRHYVDVAGERVIVEEVERALVGACRRS